ncbi:PAS domain S-box protein [Haloarchaeobius sp. DFWS5]|uniref:PAS domain S-box protein n=1 Tax=Haloarchaeobius sp. DFWS5 TaxID=3446114 RepID=UPI003EBF9026
MVTPIQVVLVGTASTNDGLLAERTAFAVERVPDIVALRERLSTGDDDIECVVTGHDPAGVDCLAVLAAVDGRVPVVVATQHGSEELAGDAVAAGAAGYLPVAPDAAGERLAKRVSAAVADVRARSVSDTTVSDEDETTADDDASVSPERRVLAEQYETVVETVPAGVFVLDADGRILGGNTRGAELLGASQSALVGTSVLDLVDEGVVDARVIEQYAAAARDLVTGDAETATVRCPATFDGEERTYEVRIAPRSPGPDGEFRGTIGILRDVTDQERRRDELERYETIIESLADPVWAVDSSGVGTFANQAYEERFGWTQDAVDDGAVHFTDTLTDEATRTILDATAELVGPGGPDRTTVEVEMVTDDGRTIPVEDHLGPLPSDDGEFRGMAGVARDVSDRKRRERRLQVLKRVLRHNLGNDMTVIAGYADLLATDASSPEQEARAETIREVAERLVDASHKVRQLESIIDHEPADRRALDVAALVDAAVGRVSERFPAADISVTRPDECYVSAHTGLQHAVEQVLENAVEHNDRDTPSVTVAARCDAEWVEFEVVDDGPGTPLQERQAVTDGDATPVDHGNGVGLSVIELVVDSLEGEMTIEDAGDDDSETGTVVTLRLPAAET